MPIRYRGTVHREMSGAGGVYNRALDSDDGREPITGWDREEQTGVPDAVESGA